MFNVFLTEYLEVYLDRKVTEDHLQHFKTRIYTGENVTAIGNATETMLMFLLKFREQGSNQVYKNKGIVYTAFEISWKYRLLMYFLIIFFLIHSFLDLFSLSLTYFLNSPPRNALSSHRKIEEGRK